MTTSHCNSCKSAKVLITQDSKNWYLTAYYEQLTELTSEVNGSTLEEQLLNTSKISVQYYTATNTIKTVKKYM